MFRLLSPIAITALALATACSGSGSGGTGACSPAGQSCTSNAQCCSGLGCSPVANICLQISEGNNGTTASHGVTTGNLQGTTNGVQGTTGGVQGTTGGGTGTGGTTGSGSSTGSASATASSGGTTAAQPSYCNGIEYQDPAAAPVYLSIYPSSDEVRSGCPTAFGTLQDAGLSLPQLAGILDVDTHYVNAATSSLYAIAPAGCDDLGQGSAPVITPTSWTAPAGGVTVESVRSAGGSGFTATTVVYGVVTYVDAPFFDATTSVAHGGLFYIQDPPAPQGVAMQSGIAVYFPPTYVSSAGLQGYPTAGLARGDVVALTGLAWMPFSLQDQLAFTSTPSITLLGQAWLPPASTVSAAQLESSSTAAPFAGMRVVQPGPDSLVDACPAVLFTP